MTRVIWKRSLRPDPLAPSDPTKKAVSTSSTGGSSQEPDESIAPTEEFAGSSSSLPVRNPSHPDLQTTEMIQTRVSPAEAAEVKNEAPEPKSPPSKSVQWSTVQINSHGVQLGDNPSVSNGPPLTISWKAFDSHVLPLEDYEKHKPESRHKQEMLLPVMVREDWLRDAGFSRMDMKEAVTEVTKTRKSRERNSRDNVLERTFKILRINNKGNNARTSKGAGKAALPSPSAVRV